MKKIFFLISILIISSCKKDLTDEVDITQNCWIVKSITIDNEKTKTPKKDYHNDIVSATNAFSLILNKDSTINLNLSINTGLGKYSVISLGKLSITEFGVSKNCCDTEFDKHLINIFISITSYQVLNDLLILKSNIGEIELKKE